MRKICTSQAAFATMLLILSALVYSLHYILFRDSHHLFMFLVGDIAFVFIEVLLVSMILHRLLEMREKREKLKKLNMVIGSFFGETGTDLLRHLALFDAEIEKNRSLLQIGADWQSKEFTNLKRQIEKGFGSLHAGNNDLVLLHEFLATHRQHLLRIVENPNILEHDRFSDMLWAVFHLEDELGHRRNLCQLSEVDLSHLSGDLQRAYQLLVVEWLAYLQHLQTDYPYLFSLARRLNPFDPQASAEVD
ncbi:MAG: hypothetical protein C0621_06370 [Desulfuromonas sp.]|nr:MAG: hypothetical protein C0621_06370 [Desulfuromonas sp.]